MHPQTNSPNLSAYVVVKKYRTILRSCLLLVILAMTEGTVAAQNASDGALLERGKPFEREVVGGQVQAYRIILALGQYLHVVVEQRNIDVVVRLSGPDGRQLLEVDSLNGMQGPETVYFIAATTGAYRLEVRPLNMSTAVGRYKVSIEELRTAGEADGPRIKAETLFSEATLLRNEGTRESTNRALGKFEEALPIFHALKDTLREVMMLNFIGFAHTSLGEKPKAIISFTEAVLLARVAGDSSGEGVALSGLGLVYLIGETQKSLEAYNRALPLFRAVGDRSNEAVTVAGLGLAYLRLGDMQNALESYTQALALARSVGDRVSEARSLAGLGYVYLRTGEKQKALDSFNQALSAARAVNDRGGEADALAGLGLVHNSSGESQKALDYLSQSLPLFRAVGDHGGEAVTLAGLGLVYLRLGDMQKALESYTQALALARAVGDRVSEARSLAGLGYVYLRTGEKQKALDSFNVALPIARSVVDRVSEADALTGLGLIHTDSGDAQKGLEYLLQSLPLFRAAGDHGGEAVTLNGLGRAYGRLGDKQKTLESFTQALPLARAAGDRSSEAMALIAIGVLDVTLGETQKAFDLLKQALSIARDIGDRQNEADALSCLGYAYGRTWETQKAIESFNQALAILRAIGDRQGEALALALCGFVYLNAGDVRNAQVSFTQARKLAREIGNPMIEAQALNGLGAVSLGEPQKAQDYLTQSFSLSRGIGKRAGDADTLIGLGFAHFFSNQAQQALDSFTRAMNLYRDLNDRYGEATALANLALVYRTEDRLTEARAHIEAAIAIIESLRTKIINETGRTSFFASAQEYYKFYIDLLMLLHSERPSNGYDGEALKASELSRSRALLDTLAEAKADIREGVDPRLVERERSLQLQFNIRAQDQMRLLRAPHTQEQANTIAKEIGDLTTAFEQVKTEIRQTSPRYAALTQPQPLTPKEIQAQMLDGDTLLLEYSLGSSLSFLWDDDDQHSYVWAVTSDSIKSYEIAGRNEINAAARRVYDLLNARNERIKGETQAQREVRIGQADSLLPAAALTLSQLVLAPVAAQLGKKRLVIVADGMLQYVPFAMLPAPTVTVSSATQQPLIFDHEIVSLPSASTLSVIRREVAGRKPAPKSVVALADPVFMKNDERLTAALNTPHREAKPTSSPAAGLTRAAAATGGNTVRELQLVEAAEDTGVSDGGLNVPRLPGSRREAQEIIAMVPASSRKLALDFEASREMATSAELSQYRYVHFSTHGFLNGVHPELSGLVFSLVNERGEPQDGFLRAHEVFNLKLPAELVVLSACKTGIGKEVKGEGLVSLTRGFMYAGAPRVVVSLWSVGEIGTAELMVRFYRAMLKEGKRPAAALREAQISLMKEKQWQSPYYWAAFTLQGEWR